MPVPDMKERNATAHCLAETKEGRYKTIRGM